MRTFFDSSSYAKRLIEESGSDVIEELCIEADEVGLSVICIPEIMSALNRRVRERGLTRAHYSTARTWLLDDIRDVAIVNLTPDVIHRSITVLENSAVRAMDAIHVACALEWHAELFVSSDRAQVLAARKVGLATRLI